MQGKQVRLILSAVIPMLALMPAVTRGQQAIACYSLSYAPESLSKYLPPRVDLQPTRLRYHRWRDSRYTRWRAPAGWSDATEIVKLTRGYGEWWQKPDSLFLEAGEQVTAMPHGRYALGPVAHGERVGTILLVLSGDPSPLEVQGTVHAKRRACTGGKDAA